MTSPGSPWRATGNTTREAFRAALARSAFAAPSPMRLEADAIYDALAPAGLTRLGAAMSWHETKNFTWTCATASAPCIPEPCRNPWAMTGRGERGQSGRWAVYGSFAAAAAAWVARITDPAGPYAGTESIRQMLEVYAPATDGNNVGLYAEVVMREIDALPVANPPGAAPANPFRAPVLYDVVKDAGRWGLTQQEAERLRANCFPNRAGAKPAAVVWHIQDGTNTSSLQWWARGAGVQASSHVMVGRDGSLIRIVYDRDGAWTNGDVNNPTAQAAGLLRLAAGRNLNLFTLTIEAEGKPFDALARAQQETICWMTWEWQRRHGIGPEMVLRHGWINSVDRANCPGAYFDPTLAMLRGVGAPPSEPVFPGLPPELNSADLLALFPEANPAGVVTRLYLQWCDATGTWPARTRIVEDASASRGWTRRFDFDGGLTICADDRGAVWLPGEERPRMMAVGDDELVVEGGEWAATSAIPAGMGFDASEAAERAA